VDLYAKLRAEYMADLAAGTGRFFEAPRKDCPWCAGPDLAVRLTTPDMHQCKPGQFTLHSCRTCGHVFQNPRLTLAGLEFYYRDFYDGLGEKDMNRLFNMMTSAYRGRVDLVRAHASPDRWLDVGTGHGHFPLTAKSILPGTVFDGLDTSDGIEIAERQGRISRGYRGLFPGLAPELAGQYDVVSMHHYLEHTREPREELDAAAIALRPGGHLLIEVPDPASRLGRLIGRPWTAWCQPQHLHLFPAGNLRQALAEHGFTTVVEQHGPAHLPGDFTFALALTLNRWAPDPRLPWLPRSHIALRRLARAALRAAAVPALAVTLPVDGTIAACLRHSVRGGNTYRLLARKDTPGPGKDTAGGHE
jgi:SAM-dependent methyltransferase